MSALCSSPDESVEKHCQDERGGEDVKPVPLGDERAERQCDPRDRRRNEKHESELDDGATVAGRNGADYSTDAAQRRLFAVEDTEPRRQVTVVRQQQHSADDNHHGCAQDAQLEQPADHALDLLVPRISGHYHTGARPRAGHSTPTRPLYSISTARTTTTAVNRRRSHSVLAPARIRAPINAPPSTPSITGNASAGSMYPRWR